MRYRFIGGLIWSLCCLQIQAQTEVRDSTLALAPVTIQGLRHQPFAIGQSIQDFDSVSRQAYLGSNLADLLSREGGIAIKPYGPGLATASIRGSGASHLAVIWNGFNLQSPMLGQVDLSQIPLAMLETIQLHRGGASALYGSGTVGGALYLDYPAQFGPELQARSYTEWGNFGHLHQALGLSFGQSRLAFRIKSFYQKARQDYRIPIRQSREIHWLPQQHARQAAWGFMPELDLKLNAQQILSWRSWIQDHDRQLPPAAEQRDRAHRHSLSWSRQGERTRLIMRTAWLADQLTYADSLSGIISHTRSQQWVNEAEWRWEPRRQSKLNAGVSYGLERAEAEAYGAQVRRSRQAIFASWREHGLTRPWFFSVSLRQGFTAYTSIPLTCSLGLGWTFSKRLEIHGAVNRNFRLPTFNDQYWLPGGNPDLLAERAWQEELGLKLQPISQLPGFRVDLTGFSNQVKDWILWLPQGSYWSAQNVQQVWARGLEAQAQWETTVGKWQVDLTAQAQYVRSTQQASRRPFDAALYKQLIYVPIWSSQGKFRLSRGPVSLQLIHTWVGKRYISSDNEQALPAYQLVDLWLSGQIPSRRGQHHLFFRLSNLWNTEYQAVAGQPMPRRHIKLGWRMVFSTLFTS